MFLFFFVNFIISRNNITYDNSYAFLFFILLIGFFPKTIYFSIAIYIKIGLLLALRKVYSLHSSKAIFKKLFDAGFWFGIVFLIEPFTILFLLLLYVALFLYQKITFQTILIPIVGFIVPVILYFTYCFWNDDFTNIDYILKRYTQYNFNFYKTKNYYLSTLFVGVFVLYSLLKKSPLAFSISNTFKKTWAILIVNLFISILFIMFLKEKNGSELLFLFFPVAVILANGIETIKKSWIKEVVLWSFLVGSFVSFFL